MTNESGVNTKGLRDDVNESSLSTMKYNLTNIKSELDYLKNSFNPEKLMKIDE